MKQQPLKLSSKVSPKDGQASLQLKEQKQTEKRLMLKKHMIGLMENSRLVARENTPKTAFSNGLVLQSANILSKGDTRTILLAELERLVRLRKC